MAKVKVFHDVVGNTLVVWFGNPHDGVDSEETGEDIILMKDKNGDVIGFEKLNFLPAPEQNDTGLVGIDFETIAPALPKS